MFWDLAFPIVIFIAAISGGLGLIVAGVGCLSFIVEQFSWRDRGTWIMFAMTPFGLFFAAGGILILLAVGWSLTQPNMGFNR